MQLDCYFDVRYLLVYRTEAIAINAVVKFVDVNIINAILFTKRMR